MPKDLFLKILIVPSLNEFKGQDKMKSNLKTKLDPKIYMLPARTLLFQQGPNEFIIEINRKSRIIMKDATAILEKAEKIKNIDPDAVVILETNAPICSKSVKFLNENGIKICEE